MALIMRRRERGAVAVEMAIILPLLLLTVGAIVDFGRAMYTQVIITNAAREGARARALNFSIAEADARVGQAMVGRQGAYTIAHELRQGAGAGTAAVNGNCPASPIVTDRTRVTVTVDFSFIFPLPVTAPSLSAQAEMRCGG